MSENRPASQGVGGRKTDVSSCPHHEAPGPLGLAPQAPSLHGFAAQLPDGKGRITDRGPGSHTTRGQAQRSALRTPGPCPCPHSPKGRSPWVPTMWAVRAYWTPPRHQLSVPTKGSSNPLRLPRPQQRPWWTVSPTHPRPGPCCETPGPRFGSQPPSSLTCDLPPGLPLPATPLVLPLAPPTAHSQVRTCTRMCTHSCSRAHRCISKLHTSS